MTFVRTRLALDRMRPGETLRVRLRGEEPLRNVPRTAREQGHEVLSLETEADGVSVLLLRRRADAAADTGRGLALRRTKDEIHRGARVARRGIGVRFARSVGISCA